MTRVRAGQPGGLSRRNGLPGFRPYVYRGTGTDTLTAFMDDLPDDRPIRVRVRPPGKVHLGRDGSARCGKGDLLTTVLTDITCGVCRNLAAGTHGFGRSTERIAA